MCYINHLGLHKLGLGMGDNPLRSCPSSLLVLWVQSRKAKKKKKSHKPYWYEYSIQQRNPIQFKKTYREEPCINLTEDVTHLARIRASQSANLGFQINED